jgi:ribosomal protein S18 acetylase RimI-like enzyme
VDIEIANDSGETVPALVLRDGWARGLGLLDEAATLRCVMARMRSTLDRKGLVKVATGNGGVWGAIALRESPFDSEGLGVKSVVTVDTIALARAVGTQYALGRAVLERLADALDAFCAERESTLDWLRVDSGDMDLLQALIARGFRCVGLVFSLARAQSELALPAPLAAGLAVRPVRPTEDAPALQRIASAAFTESRFRDTEGPQGWNAHVYARWIQARLGQLGDELRFLVAEREGKVAGFLIWKIHETPGTQGKTGQVDLIAVDPRFRGQGVGRGMLDEARRISPALEWIASDVYARNAPGLAVHQHYGLRIAAGSVYLHRWRQPAPATLPETA